MALATHLTLTTTRQGNLTAAELRTLAGGVRELSQALRGFSGGGRGFRDASVGLSLLGGGTRKLKGEMKGLTRDFVESATAAKRAERAYYEQRQTLNALAYANRKARDSMRDLAMAQRNASMGFRKFRNEMQVARSTALDFSYLMGNLARTSGIALAAVGGGMLLLSKKVIETRAEFENLEQQILTLTGNKGAFGKIREFALKSPLTFKESVGAVRDMINAGIQFGDVMRADAGYLETLTKAAVFANRPLEQLVRALSAVRGGAWRNRDLLAIDVTKDTVEQAGLKWDGKKNRPAGLNAETGPAILDRIIRQLSQNLANFRPEDLLKTKLSNIQDALDLFFNALGASFDKMTKPLLGRIQKLIVDLTKTLSSPQMQQALASLATLMEQGFNKLLDATQRLVNMIAADPTLIPRWLNSIAETIKNLAAVFVAATIAAHVASLAQAISTLVLAFTGGPGAIIGIIAIIVAFGAALIATKGKLNQVLPDLRKVAGEMGSLSTNAAGASKELPGVASGLEGIGSVADTAAGKIAAVNKELERLKGQTPEGQADEHDKQHHAGVAAQRAEDYALLASNRELGKWLDQHGHKLPASEEAKYDRPHSNANEKYSRLAVWWMSQPRFDKEAERDMDAAMKNRRFNPKSPEVVWPVKTPRDQTRVGGYDGVHGHSGWDLFGKAGDPGYAPITGTIKKLGLKTKTKTYEGDLGFYIIADPEIYKGTGLEGKAVYITHVDQHKPVGLKEGQKISAGDLFGYMKAKQGRAAGGYATDPHWHISVVKEGKYDPDNSPYDPGKILFGGPLQKAAGTQVFDELQQEVDDKIAELVEGIAADRKAYHNVKAAGVLPPAELKKRHDELIKKMADAYIEGIGMGGFENYSSEEVDHMGWAARKVYGKNIDAAVAARNHAKRLFAWDTPYGIQKGGLADTADKMRKPIEEAAKAQQKISEERKKQLIEDLNAQKEAYDAIADGVKEFVDKLKEQIDALHKLKDRIVDARDNFLVALQKAMGFDRGADAMQANILARKAREAYIAYSNDPSETNLAALGEAGVAGLEFVGGMRQSAKPGEKLNSMQAEQNQIAQWLFGQLQGLGLTNPAFAEKLAAAEQTVQQKIDTTNAELVTQTSYLANLQALLQAIHTDLAKANGKAAGTLNIPLAPGSAINRRRNSGFVAGGVGNAGLLPDGSGQISLDAFDDGLGLDPGQVPLAGPSDSEWAALVGSGAACGPGG